MGKAMNPADRAAALFRDAFGAPPAAVASAPGRVNLIGEHLDYYGGRVLPCATAARAAVAVGPGRDDLRGVSEQLPPCQRAWTSARAGDWADYLVGAVLESGAGAALAGVGLHAAVASDLPPGAGLASSAALEVATVLAVSRWLGRPLSERETWQAAWRAETDFVGVPCGIMDQLASATCPPGGALLVDCGTQSSEPVPAGLELLLADSGERRELQRAPYAERRGEGERALSLLRAAHPSLRSLTDVPPARLPGLLPLLPAPLERRVRHVVGEQERVMLGARALERGDLVTFGSLVSASHDSLSRLYQCSTARLDAIAAAARGMPGVLGARLHGAGWGGAVLVVVEPGAGDGVAARLSEDGALALPDVRAVRMGAGALR